MKKLAMRILLTAAVFVGFGVSVASAQSINLSNDPVYAQQFYHYCPPFEETFVNNGTYAPTDRGCIYSIPTDVRALGQAIAMTLYQGEPGNSTRVRQELVFDGSFYPTLVRVQDPTNFSSYSVGDKFFGVVFSAGPLIGFQYPDLEQFNEAFTTGATTTPNNTYHLIQWQLGSADTTGPHITITSPTEGASYAQNAVVPFSVTISDASPIKFTHYIFNGNLVDPNQPLPLASAPLGSASVTVVSSDIYDNFSDEVTVNFTITPPVTDVCPNVPGTQTSGPCADQVCLDQGGTWDGSSCVLPPTDVCPNVPGTQESGPCADQVCVNNGGTWNGTSCVLPPTDTAAPVINITNPLRYALYARAETVYLTANITDTSPLAETTYWLNGKKINPANPLTFNSSTPIISKVAVAASDIYGNKATSTLAFFVVKNKNSCLIDIVAILVALKLDNTLPNKPTLEQLIADCAALLKGYHHGH